MEVSPGQRATVPQHREQFQTAYLPQGRKQRLRGRASRMRGLRFSRPINAPNVITHYVHCRVQLTRLPRPPAFNTLAKLSPQCPPKPRPIPQKSRPSPPVWTESTCARVRPRRRPLFRADPARPRLSPLSSRCRWQVRGCAGASSARPPFPRPSGRVRARFPLSLRTTPPSGTGRSKLLPGARGTS